MNILVEGPHWMGEWSEIVCDALNGLGHTTKLHYHNVKPLRYRFGRLIAPLQRLVGGQVESRFDWSNRALLKAAAPARVDLLLSIQGKIDGPTVRLLRDRNPGLKIVYWLGDVVFPGAELRIEEIYEHVDRVLISYRGDADRLRRRLGTKIVYFPFGYSPRYHRLEPLTKADLHRYSAQVSFVGTWYPERETVLAPLAAANDFKLSVWGRSWRHASAIRSCGRLTMSETLKVHRLSQISLNIHHHMTRNGFNMKFYEIPAVGGFQICDWQEELELSGLADKVVTFRNEEEMLELIRYYLNNPVQREGKVKSLMQYVTENLSYEQNLTKIALHNLF